MEWKMSREYKVEQGDTIDSIARRFHLLPASIWDDPKNKDLKDKRKNPNTLLRGDIVHLKKNGQKKILAPGKQKHKFKSKSFKSTLKLVFLDDDKPRKNADYVLKIDDKPSIKGKTNSQGVIEEKVSAKSRKARLIFLDSDETYWMQIGFLDPADTVSGIQGRLTNLGYGPGPIDGDMGAQTRSAVRRFQKDNKLDLISDEDAVDQKTIDKIDKAFGE